MRTVFIFLGATLALLGAACGSGSPDSGKPTIVATTGIAAELAEKVAGPDAEVELLVPETASPHDFQLSAADRQLLEEADLVIAVGSGLEASVPLEEVGAPTWALTEHAGKLLPFAEAGAHDDEHTGEDAERAGTDPHVWMDPSRAARALPSLATALADVAPGAAARYRRRASTYTAELRRLDRELRRTLGTVPAANRELVTSHDSLGYLAARYGFEVVATAFPPTGPEAEASAARLQEVEEAIAEHDVPSVFAQQEDDPDTLRLIAEQAGVEVEDGLLVEAPGAAGSYVEMLRTDAKLIAEALGG